MMSLFFMRFTESIKNTSDTGIIHARLRSTGWTWVASVRERTIITTCVSGSTASARYWTDSGRSERGKKVPLKRNMGVMNRNMG